MRENMGSEEEAARLKKMTAAKKKHIKSGMQSCFCLTFRSKRSDNSKENRKLRQLFEEACQYEEGCEYFLFCLRHLLERTCEKASEKPSRINCLIMIANVSLILSRRRQPEMLDYLIDFSEKTCCFNVVHVRLYACRLIGLLLSLCETVDKVFDQATGQEEISCLSDNNRRRLFKMLMDRELDSSGAVRAEVIRAMKTAQHDGFLNISDGPQDSVPENVILKHFRDISWECRVAAVETVSLSNDINIKPLMEVAISEKDARVRKAALLHLAKEAKIQNLSDEQRMMLLRFLVSTNDKVRLDILKRLLREWLRSMIDQMEDLADNAAWKVVTPKLLEILDIFAEEMVCHHVIMTALSCCREEMGLLTVGCRDFIKEVVYSDNALVVNSYNYKNLLNKRLPSSELAKAAFFLRCMIDFCKLQSRTEGDWSDCQYKLLPTMHTFYEFVKRFVTSEIGVPVDQQDVIYRRFALKQFLDLVWAFDKDDTAGRKTWTDLMEHILVNCDLTLSYVDVNHIVQLMYQFLWPLPEDKEDALSAMCDITSLIIHRDLNPNATLNAVNETIALPSVSSLPENLNASEKALLRCVMIVNSMMKTNRYKTMHTLLWGLLDNVVEKGLISQNPECRVLSFEAMGMIAVCDRNCCQQNTIFVKDTMEFDDTLKAVVLKMLCSFSLEYGFENVSIWFRGTYDFADPANDLLEVFCIHIWDKDPLTSFAACECLCKLMFDEHIEGSTRVLRELLLKAFDPDCSSKLAACLNNFIEGYSSSSREHQLCFVDCFKDVIDGFIKRPAEESVLRIGQSAIGLRIASATRLQSLKTTEEEKSSVQPQLCAVILSMLSLEDSGYNDDALCATLRELDVNTWQDLKVLHCLEQKIDEVIQDFETGNVTRALKAFSTRISEQIHKLGGSTRKVVTGDVYGGSEEDEDEEVRELVKRTKTLQIRTPQTRSVTRKVRGAKVSTAEETPLRPLRNRNELVARKQLGINGAVSPNEEAEAHPEIEKLRANVSVRKRCVRFQPEGADDKEEVCLTNFSCK